MLPFRLCQRQPMLPSKFPGVNIGNFWMKFVIVN